MSRSWKRRAMEAERLLASVCEKARAYREVAEEPSGNLDTIQDVARDDLEAALTEAEPVIGRAGLRTEPTETEKRDAALDLLAEKRADLVRLARSTAMEIASANGSVTSPEVIEALRQKGHGRTLDLVDRRFMGVVFRAGWRAVGRKADGSHARTVPVWEPVQAGAATRSLLGL